MSRIHKMSDLYTHGQIFYHGFQLIIALALQDKGFSLSLNQWGRGDYLQNSLIAVLSTEYIKWVRINNGR